MNNQQSGQADGRSRQQPQISRQLGQKRRRILVARVAYSYPL